MKEAKLTDNPEFSVSKVSKEKLTCNEYYQTFK